MAPWPAQIPACRTLGVSYLMRLQVNVVFLTYLCLILPLEVLLLKAVASRCLQHHSAALHPVWLACLFFLRLVGIPLVCSSVLACCWDVSWRELFMNLVLLGKAIMWGIKGCLCDSCF